ncbi:MAG: integrase arm-type DNA-binding domain-containing protein [Woeseia sp.]
MRLTDTTISNAKPAAKPQRLFDGGGLYLEVAPSGGKWWRLKYRYAGKEKRISLGVYPRVSLDEARTRRDAAKQQLSNGIDPSAARKAQKALRQTMGATSFEAVAREWFAKHEPKWSQAHAVRVISGLQRDVFPEIGASEISQLTPQELLSTVRRIEKRGALETAHRILSLCGQIMRYALATGRAARDISADLRGALPQVKAKHFPAVTKPDQIAELLRAIDAYQGTPVVSSALKLAPLVFVRPGELRKARWKEIDLKAAEWRFTVAKSGIEHVVPLSRQAIPILANLQTITSNSDYVFPGGRSRTRPMSDNAILAALRSMGISKDTMTGHGFRAMARTILGEVLGFRPELIEQQLGNTVEGDASQLTNKSTHLRERKKMMQAWADYLDRLKTGSDEPKTKKKPTKKAQEAATPVNFELF